MLAEQERLQKKAEKQALKDKAAQKILKKQMKAKQSAIITLPPVDEVESP